MTTFPSRTKSLSVLVALAVMSSGCELILDFNRNLIDSGAGDATFVDSSADAGVDAKVDALVVPDAVSDVVFTDAPFKDTGVDATIHDSGTQDTGTTRDTGVDAGHDAGVDAGRDAGRDAGHDAGVDAGHDAGRDAGHDSGVDAALDAPHG